MRSLRLVVAVVLLASGPVAASGLFAYDGQVIFVAPATDATAEARPELGLLDSGKRGRASWDSFDHRSNVVRASARLGGYRLAPRSIRSGRPTAPTPDVAFHYTSGEAAESIARTGLRPGGFATPNGGLSPLQAQIDLALPPNRGLPGGLVQIDVAGLRRAGFEIPEVTQVGRSYGMPGGWEMRFPFEVPSEFLKSVPNKVRTVTRGEARTRLQSCRDGDDRDPYPILTRMKQVFESASASDQRVLNEVVREWLISNDPKDRFDGAWLTDELRLESNLDLVRKLRDEAESRSDPAAPYDWSKFNEIAGRLASSG